MSSAQISEWMAYYNLEPFGDDWRQTGVVAGVIANVNRDAKKKRRPYEPEDFMPITKRQEQAQSPEILLAKARMITAAFQGMSE